MTQTCKYNINFKKCIATTKLEKMVDQRSKEAKTIAVAELYLEV